jgi:type VI secretion system protein ImpA
VQQAASKLSGQLLVRTEAADLKLQSGESVTDFDRFIAPIEGESPCGPDFEYDNEFLALSQAVAGKPEQQFGDTVIPAVEPDWREVDRLCQDLLARTKDIRIVAWLTLANTHLHGVTHFAAGLKLALSFCEQYWESVHPRIEIDGDTDPYLRMNALSAFSGSEFSGEDRLIQALRAALLVRQPLPLSFRAAELAFNKAPEAEFNLSQIEPIFNDALAAGNQELPAVVEAYAAYKALCALIDERVTAAEAPDMERLTSILKPVAQGVERLQSSASSSADEVSAAANGESATTVAGPGGSGLIQSREDARRALDRVCEYLERHEPSNPASLFARRAQRLLSMPFLEIMRELSPDSMSHLELLTGVKPKEQDY